MEMEKVIKGLKHCFHGQECCGDIECPYYIEHLSDCCCLEECQENLKADTLAMLKEQQREIEILKAMGLKMPEITVLTDKPIYKVDT